MPGDARQPGEGVMHLTADRTAGIAAGFDSVALALRAVRERSIVLGTGLDAESWNGPSRCELWTAHDVLRHVRDACRLHVGGLRRDPYQPLDEGFDNRVTPQKWLERSAGQPPDVTMQELRRFSAEEAVALSERTKSPDGEVVSGPYGRIPWTVLSAHVLWDAWLHERDVAQLARGGLPSTPVEDAVVALYALFIASIPAMVRAHNFTVTVALESDGCHFSASVAPGHVEMCDVASPVEADLHGELGAVVDSLAGRGADPAEVIDGDAAKREPLTWLRAMLAPPM